MFETSAMTVDTAPRPNAPAAGLFGGGKPAPQAAAPVPQGSGGEPSATQRKAFTGLFRADGSELHAA
jgi:hypothetical protein